MMNIAFQQEFSQQIPEVIGNLDYINLRNRFTRIDELIISSNIEKVFIDYHLQNIMIESQRKLSDKVILKAAKRASKGFRCTLALKLMNCSFREFSIRLADSPLLQKFCHMNRIDIIKVPSKSELDRFEKMFPVKMINQVMENLIDLASTPCSEEFDNPLDLKKEISVEDIFIDTTCVEGNIHFPVDWILLRDAVKTLMKSVHLIRKLDLKNRMDSPSSFIKAMNKSCIEMTHAKNRKTQKKERKRIFRCMKKLTKKVQTHALKHKELLDEQWEETKISKNNKTQIINRIDNVLTQLPKAIHQATERIIGGRLVKNERKILSLYEQDIHVCNRGKAGAAVEFGNTLVLSEQHDGIIVDWNLYKEKSPGDTNILRDSVNRLLSYEITSVTTDRGMCSKSNQNFLNKNFIQDYMCPRSPKELQERLKEHEFCEHQKRRGQTEGRIGIFKNKFLGKPFRSKGYENRKRSIAWSVLAHNLWVIARLDKVDEDSLKKVA